MVKTKISIGLLIIITGILFGICFNYYSGSPTVNQIIKNITTDVKAKRNIEFLFYDIKENCTIDGEVFVKNYSLGNTKEGILLLDESEYINNLLRRDSKILSIYVSVILSIYFFK